MLTISPSIQTTFLCSHLGKIYPTSNCLICRHEWVSEGLPSSYFISVEWDGFPHHTKKLGTEISLAPQKQIQAQQSFQALELMQTEIILTVDKMYICGP